MPIGRWIESDHSRVDIYDRKTNKYQATLKLDRKVKMIPDKKDKKQIKEHNRKIERRIIRNIEGLKTDIETGWEELKSFPVQSNNSEYHEKEKLNTKKRLDVLYANYPFRKYSEKRRKKSVDSKNDYIVLPSKKRKYKEIKK